MFSKVDVNGEMTHPVFDYLTGELRSTFGRKVKWNFTKFLVDRNGKPVKRFSPTTKPEQLAGRLAEGDLKVDDLIRLKETLESMIRSLSK